MFGATFCTIHPHKKQRAINTCLLLAWDTRTNPSIYLHLELFQPLSLRNGLKTLTGSNLASTSILLDTPGI